MNKTHSLHLRYTHAHTLRIAHVLVLFAMYVGHSAMAVESV